MGKYGLGWQSHSFSTFCCKKGVRIMLKKRHTWPHLTKCIAVMTKKNSRSRMTKKTLIFGVPGKQMFSNFFSSERRKRLSLRKRFASLRCPLRLPRPMFFLAPQSHLSTTGSDTFPGTSSRQDWTCFWGGRWALTRNQMQSMDLNARFDGHSHGMPWLCCVNTRSATFPVQWDSSFCGKMV